MPRRKQVSVIDLFAGAGGLSVGAHEAGANVAASLEFDATACETLRTNPEYHGEVVEGDVCDFSGNDLRRIAGLKPTDRLVIVGGPPCQPFSKAAYWTEEGNDAAYRRARAEGRAVSKPDAPTKVKDDSRRDLVKEFWRVVTESKADGFVFENVPGRSTTRWYAVHERLATN